jgi:pimeloyl-ACP methyl ester carboxylesterase
MKKVLLAVVVVILLCAIATGLAFFRQPFWFFERMGRLALRGAGLQRVEITGPRGLLVYFRGGAGPPVVLIHGANDQAGAWAHVAGPLVERGYHLLVVDLAGHGESEPPAGPLGMEDLLGGLETVLQGAALEEKATLVGNSLGGFVAMSYAVSHPRQVSHVILVNGAAIRGEGPGAAVNLLPKNRDQARRAIEALTDPGSPRVPDFVLDDLVRRSPGSPLDRLLQSQFAEYALDTRLGDVEIPVTLLWGESDRLMPPEYAERIAKGLPIARLVPVPRCGHAPQRECPERFLPLLEQALAAPPTPPAEDAPPVS